MKILHVLDHSLPLHSGYTFRSRNIFKCQQYVGLTPIVVTSPKHETSWRGEWLPEEVIDGVRYFRTGGANNGRMPFLSELRLMKKLQRRIHALCLTEKPSIIHAHSPVLNAIPAIRVGRELGIPVVYEIRAFWEDAAVDHGTYKEQGLKYKLVKSMETRACRRVNSVITICEGLRADLVSRGIPAEKITVVPNAVNAEDFTPCERDPELARKWGLEGAFVVGFLGSFYRYEGLDLLLEAVARLATEQSNLKLLLVGGGEMESALKEQARVLNINEKVIFTGRLPHDQMPAIYSLVDVLVFPRKRMRLTDLVTPLKPLEAMAMGKSLIASDVGGHEELIQNGETGLLFRADDPANLIESLVRLISDVELRRCLGLKGRKWVESEKNWRINGRAYCSFYKGVSAGSEVF